MVVAKLVLTERELTIIRKVLDGFSSGQVLRIPSFRLILTEELVIETHSKPLRTEKA